MDTKVMPAPVQKKRRLTLPMILVITVTVLLIAIVLMWQMLPFIWGMIFGGGGGGMGAGGPPPVVSTMVARQEDWQQKLQIVGSLRAYQGADLAFEVPGVVEKVFFESGGDVRTGSVLVTLRSGDDLARLRTLQATARLAQTNYARAQRLWSIKGISRQQVEEYAAALASARAQVAEAQALLAKKILRAPFAGHLGLRHVNVGDYVNPGTAIVTLQALDPIFLDFSVPQQKLAQLKVGQPVMARFDAYPGVAFTGQITVIDPKADPQTRNVSVRATFPNADRRLVPGMYASAEILVGQPQRFVTLPQTAVTFNPYGQTVYVIERKSAGAGNPPTLTVRQNFITTGDTRGDQIQVLTGIKAGDEVVTAGQIKIQNGATVAINNKIQPTNNPNPAPVER